MAAPRLAAGERPNLLLMVADDLAAARFRQRLFFDPRLSGNGQVSCATCHDPAQEFTDGLRLAEGVGLNRRNTPTVLNAGHHRWLTWDGRSDSLWAQALEPLENEVEMNGDRTSIVGLVAEDPDHMLGPREMPNNNGNQKVRDRVWLSGL